jgi:hypothetical protein
MRAAEQGDVDGFVRGLSRRSYFTANPDDYRRSLRALLSKAETESFGGSRALTVETPGPALDMLLWTLARATAKKAG